MVVSCKCIYIREEEEELVSWCMISEEMLLTLRHQSTTTTNYTYIVPNVPGQT